MNQTLTAGTSQAGPPGSPATFAPSTESTRRLLTCSGQHRLLYGVLGGRVQAHSIGSATFSITGRISTVSPTALTTRAAISTARS